MAEEPSSTVPKLHLGQEVSARWTNGDFYGATVLVIEEDRFLAKWNDGHEPTWVARTDVKIEPPPVEPYQLRVGMAVSAQWTDGGYYQATLDAIENGRYLAKWIDGGTPTWVSAGQLRLQGPAVMAPAILSVGLKVRAAWTDGKMYPATILTLHDGRVEVEFEGTSRRVWLLPAQITPRG